MNMKRSSERGQVLILLVLAFVVLLGFVALALDGGMVYADRRRAQNAADASSLAGGVAAGLSLENDFVDYEVFTCVDNGQPEYNEMLNALAVARAAAVSRATSNDYAIDQDITDNNGVAAVCGIYDTGGWVDKYVDITATITADTTTSFAHFIYNGPLRNTVRAVTRVRPRMPVAFGNAIVALALECPNSTDGGIQFQGVPGDPADPNDSIIINGGIFSNACMACPGNEDVTVNGSAQYITTEFRCDAFATNQANLPLPKYSWNIPEPDCSNPPAHIPDQHGGGSIGPGHYGRIRVTAANDLLILSSGLYCIHEEFTINGGEVRIDPLPNGNPGGVTISMVDGPFNIGGNTLVTLAAPPTTPTNTCGYCPPAIPGLLIYSDQVNASSVRALGTAGSSYTGMIFAPTAQVDVGGDTGVFINGQVIGDTVIVHGGPQVQVNYGPDVNFRPPASLELFR